MYQTILFDLDGTLTDPGEGITNSVTYALEKFEIKNEDRSQLYKFIGPPLKDSFMEFYGFSEEDALKAIAYYRERFREKGMFENKVYDGIVELLSKLKHAGKKLIVATSKPEEFTLTILKHFDLLQYFDFVAGATMDGSRSEKEEIIHYALEHCQIENLDETVMVGDRKFDILGAKTNGIDSIGVLFGYGSLEELEIAGATYIADSPEMVEKLVLL
ncbi:MAG: HAD family hydrolase [Lachnospiraceae bacterium]|nr:HAD family hydrolase [Lachnospiraceae bacterium]